MRIAILLLAFMAVQASIVAQELITPVNGTMVRATIPHFRWESKVAYPWPGTYRIEIARDAAFSQIVHRDEIPAILEHYAPATSLPYAADPLHWRLQYVSAEGVAEDWKMGAFFHQAPTDVVTLPTSADWNTIRKAFSAAKDKAAATNDWVMLEFEKGTYALTQGEGSALFEARGQDGGVLVEGNGSTFVLTATADDCGAMLLKDSSHGQFRNFTIDYTAESASQASGTITAVNHAKSSFVIRMLPGSPSFPANPAHMFFIDAEHHQRIPGSKVGYEVDVVPGNASAGAYQCRIAGKRTIKHLPVKVGDIALTDAREGNLILADKSQDLCFENITSLACRSRLLIPRRDCTGFRVINCSFKNTRTGLLAAPSGGINSTSDQVWFEGCTFEGTRDDAVNLRAQQNVVRNCRIASAYRHTIWVHEARHWIAGNILEWGGTSGISLGGTGLSGRADSMVQAVVVEGNTVRQCNNEGLELESIKPSKVSSTLAGVPGVPQDRHSHIRIIGNTFIGTGCQPVISLCDATSVFLVDNRLLDGNQPVPADAKDDAPTAISRENVTDYHEEGTSIEDKRIRQ